MLKEAISAVAVAPLEENLVAVVGPHGWDPQQQRAAPAWDPQQQQVAPAWHLQQAEQQQQPGVPASFMQLLSCEVVMPDVETAGFLQQDALAAAGRHAAALALPAFMPTPGAGAGFEPQATPQLPATRFDEQPPAAMVADPPAQGFAALAAAPPIAGVQRHPHAMGPAAGSSTPAAAHRCSGSPLPAGPQLGQAEAEAPATDPRKPRGLLGLLQTPAEKAAPAESKPGTAGRVAKAARPRRQTQPRKTPASAKGGTTKGGAGQKKKGAATATAAGARQQQYAGLALPAGFTWAHMHPQLQQPQPQQQQPVLQPALLLQGAPSQAQQPPLLQQPAPALPNPLAGGGGAAGPLDFGNDTLLHFLDASGAGGTAPGGWHCVQVKARPPGSVLCGCCSAQPAVLPRSSPAVAYSGDLSRLPSFPQAFRQTCRC